MTYSLAVNGIGADSTPAIKNITLPDDAARAGAMQLAMRNGSQLLCRGPDGGFRYYTLDAERSTPLNPILLAVGGGASFPTPQPSGAGAWVTVVETGVGGNSSIQRPRNIRQLLTANPGTSGSKVRITFRLGTFSGDMTVNSCYIGHGVTVGNPCDFESTPTPVTFGGLSSFVLPFDPLDHVSDEITFALNSSKPLLITFYLNGDYGELSAITPGSGGTFFDKGGANETGTINVGAYGGGQTSIRTIAKVEAFQS